jgi:putative ABC transport system ATP-binding protein
MNKTVQIQIKNVKKIYQMGEVQVKALDDVSLDIYEGEFAVILGPSGSGKSTLLNVIGGMDGPDEGIITVANEEITKFNDKKLTAYRRNNVGFVFQFYNLMANLTARENVELATELCKEKAIGYINSQC